MRTAHVLFDTEQMHHDTTQIAVILQTHPHGEGWAHVTATLHSHTACAHMAVGAETPDQEERHQFGNTKATTLREDNHSDGFAARVRRIQRSAGSCRVCCATSLEGVVISTPLQGRPSSHLFEDDVSARDHVPGGLHQQAAKQRGAAGRAHSMNGDNKGGRLIATWMKNASQQQRYHPHHCKNPTSTPRTTMLVPPC
jgi:hypothetical protein